MKEAFMFFFALCIVVLVNATPNALLRRQLDGIPEECYPTCGPLMNGRCDDGCWCTPEGIDYFGECSACLVDQGTLTRTQVQELAQDLLTVCRTASPATGPPQTWSTIIKTTFTEPISTERTTIRPTSASISTEGGSGIGLSIPGGTGTGSRINDGGPIATDAPGDTSDATLGPNARDVSGMLIRLALVWYTVYLF